MFYSVQYENLNEKLVQYHTISVKEPHIMSSQLAQQRCSNVDRTVIHKRSKSQ